MIARLRGTLAEKAPGEVLVDIAGVGFAASISLQTFSRLPAENAEVTLHTVTHMRETGVELFAFHSHNERSLFNVLRGVSGIGPRLALSILSGIEASEFAQVVGAGDVARLVSVPGVGKKTAERIVVELRDKMSGFVAEPVEDGGRDVRDAVTALVALGYKNNEAEKAVRHVRDSGDDIESLIRKALARMA